MDVLKNAVYIGDMDRRIVIRNYTEAQDGYGDVKLTFGTLATVWAKVEYSALKEAGIGEKETAVYRVDFTIRYRSDLDEAMQISYDSKTFDIENISEVGRKEYQVIRAKLLA